MKIKLPQPEYDVAELEALIAQAKQPIEGQVYRWKDGDGCERRVRSGRVEYRVVGIDAKWEYEPVDTVDDLAGWLASGAMVPYTPPAPTFKVGEWVRPIDDGHFRSQGEWTWNGVAKKVIEPLPGRTVNPEMVWCQFKEPLWTPSHQLRHATPEEIAAATRIVPKAGLIVKRNDTGIVSLLTAPDGMYWKAITLTAPHKGERTWSVDELTTELYTVLKSYLIEGAEP